MNTLTGSIVSILEGIDEPGVPPDREHEEAPSLEAAQDLHKAAVTLARGRMTLALSCALLVPPIVVIAAVTRSGPFVITLPVLFIAWAAVAVYEWWTLRRSDPLESWRRERQEEIEERAAKIEHQTRAATNTPAVTYTLAAIVAGVTAVQFFAAGLRESAELAGLVKPAVRAGEWWRLLSATYLHGNVRHVAGNISVLLGLGALIEIYDRRLRVPLAYLAGGIGGSVASTMLLANTSVGASGAILGLLGYLIAIRVGPRSAPNWMRKRLVGSLGMIALTGAAGYLFIDNAGHAGGVAAGLAVGVAARQASRNTSLMRVLDVGGWIASAILCGGAMFTIGRLLRAW